MEHPRTSLLGLPRELRDHILSYLLFDSRNAPISPLFPDKRIEGSQGIMLPAKTLPPRRSQVLNVNRQLREEARDLINALYMTGHATTEVDVMVKGYQLWPTWTYMPIILHHGKHANMNVHLRLFSTESFQPASTWPGSAGFGLRGLYTLLNLFLRHGTSIPWTSTSTFTETDPYCIDTLTIRISFLDIYTPDTWPATIAEIVAKLKVFVTAGIPYPYVRKVKLECDYLRADEQISVRREWVVEERFEVVPLDDWQGACVHFYGRMNA